MTPGRATSDVTMIKAAAEIGVRNSQPPGIGRVAVLGDLACWNNLGRNIVFADRRLRPRAVFGQTLFPDQDEPSQYDLDIHAILDVPELDLVLVLNHHGFVRGFSRSALRHSGPLRQVEPALTTVFAADVERTVLAGRHLVGSRPRCDGAEGVLVSSPIMPTEADTTMTADLAAESFGEVTALGVVGDGRETLVVLGGVDRLLLVPVDAGRLLRPRWQVEIGFRAAVVAWEGGLIWAAGSASIPGVDDYDWEALKGGGFVALDPGDGRAVLSGPLPEDVAWGTGGVAIVVLGNQLAAIGRTGRVYLLDPRHPAQWQSTAPLATASLGLAHADVIDGRVLFGFNRGRYQLYLSG